MSSLSLAASKAAKSIMGSRKVGSKKSYEQGLQLFVLVLKHLLECSDSIPVVGNFATILKKLLDITDAMKLNKESARAFSVILFDTASIVDEGIKLVLPLPNGDERGTKINVISRIVFDLRLILEEAIAALQSFAKKGFFGRVIACSERPAYKFEVFDLQITRKLHEFSTALSIAQFSLSEHTYSAVSDIQKWCNDNGGFADIIKDQVKIAELASQMGADIEDMEGELSLHLEMLNQIDSKLDAFSSDQSVYNQIMAEMMNKVLALLSQPATDADKVSTATQYPPLSWTDLSIDWSHPVGEGGFGTVYSGMYKGERVAIKTFRSSLAVLGSKVLQDFSREVSIMHAVREHPNIVSLITADLDSAVKDRPPCVVLELADGSLHDALYNSYKIEADVDLSLHSKINWLIEMAEAFVFIGEKCNIVFRDLKPMNILLKDNHIKITDFGLAKRATDQTTMHAAKGTANYMSPEALRGEIVSWKTDVWAFGLTADETLSQRVPFEGRSYEEVRNEVVVLGKRDTHFVASSPSDHIGFALAKIIMACLNFDAQRRPSFSILSSDLRKVLKATLDVSRSGASSVYYTTALDLSSTAMTGRIPLKSLTVDQVVALFQQLDMPDTCAAILRCEKINGNVLSLIEKHEEFNSECELGLKAIKSRALMNSMNEYKAAGGVPAELLVPLGGGGLVVLGASSSDSATIIVPDTADVAPDTDTAATTAAVTAAVTADTADTAADGNVDADTAASAASAAAAAAADGNVDDAADTADTASAADVAVAAAPAADGNVDDAAELPAVEEPPHTKTEEGGAKFETPAHPTQQILRREEEELAVADQAPAVQSSSGERAPSRYEEDLTTDKDDKIDHQAIEVSSTTTTTPLAIGGTTADCSSLDPPHARSTGTSLNVPSKEAAKGLISRDPESVNSGVSAGQAEEEEPCDDAAEEARKKRQETAKHARFDIKSFPGLRGADDFARGAILNKGKIKEQYLTFQWSGVIPKSLLDLNKDNNKLAVQIFKDLLGYMGDKQMPFPEGLAQDILRKGYEHKPIRDEIYLQIIKQLTNNPRQESVAKGWQVMCMCVSTFPPSFDFEFFLLHYILEKRDKGRGAVVDYARYCLRTLEAMLSNGDGTGFVPSVEEILAYKERPPILATIYQVDGNVIRKDVPLAPGDNVGKVLEMCTGWLDLKDPRANTLGVFVYDLGESEDAGTLDESYRNAPYRDLPRTPRPLRNEDFMGDIIVQKARQMRKFKFVLKKKIFLPQHNGRGDDPVYERLVYLQAEDETIIQGNIDIDDVERVVALASISMAVAFGEEMAANSPGLVSADVADFIVPTWRKQKKAVEWADLVLAKRDALVAADPEDLQDQFLQIVQESPVYGTHWFFVHKVDTPPSVIVPKNVGQLPRDIILAFNAKGMHIYSTNRKCLISHPYTDIYRWGGSSSQFSFILADEHDSFEFVVITGQGADMAAIILDHIRAIMAEQGGVL